MKVTKTGSRVHPKMSKTRKKMVKEAKKIDVSASLISAVRDGDLVSVKKLVHSYGLSYCECGNGGYLLLFVAIELGRIEIAKLLLQEGAKADCETNNVSTPLHLAARQGFTGLVQLLLEKNVAVDARNSQHETPLHLAAKEGYAEVVEVLLNNSASVTAQTNEGATPLFLAAEARYETVVQMLLKHACINFKDLAKTRNSTLLNRVLLCNPRICEKVNKLVVCIVTEDDGHRKIVDELFDHGFILSRKFLNESFLSAAIDINYVKLIDSALKNGVNHYLAKHYPQLLHTAVRIGHVEIAEIFLKAGFNANATDGEGKTALYYSLYCDQDDKYVGILELLFANGANITKAPNLLHQAVREGLIEVCKVLIKNGATVNKLDIDGRTPLYLAVPETRTSIYGEPKWEGKGQTDDTTEHKIVEFLLNCGADININVRGHTAFHKAVLSGRKSMVSIFLKMGVDVDIRTEYGSTPLSLAAREGDTEIVEILCENNADVNAGIGQTSPLCVAASKWNVEVVKVLLKFGAHINFYIVETVNDNIDWYSDDSEDNDDIFDTKYVLFQHVVKLKVAGFHVREQIYDEDYEDDHFELQEDCAKELNKLKNVKLNPQFSLYDVLVNGKNPRYVKEKSILRKLKSYNLDEFPLYKYLIRSNVRKSIFRLELLQSGLKWLDILVKTSNKLNGTKYSVLPVEILEQIVSYLSNSEIKSLISCGKALKHQLSQ